LADAYAERAVALLRQAVVKGYRSAARWKKDKDLAPLRGRPEFQKLLAEVGGKNNGSKSSPQSAQSE
jgi:hypothetical protein